MGWVPSHMVLLNKFCQLFRCFLVPQFYEMRTLKIFVFGVDFRSFYKMPLHYLHADDIDTIPLWKSTVGYINLMPSELDEDYSS
jgi:hypothetical protein